MQNEQPSSTPTALDALRKSAASFLSALNNIRKNLLRLYRQQKWQLNHLLLFPVTVIYLELLLRLFTGTGFFRALIYPVLFGLACGLFCAGLTSAFRPKVNRILSMVLLYGLGLLFTVECLIRNSFQVYMTLGAIRKGTGGVVGGFSSDLFRAILTGIPKIFLFFLPAILYTGTGKRRMPARRYQLPFVGALVVMGLLIQGGAVLGATHGANKARYREQFNFDTATQVFGLITSTRLQLTGAGTDSDFVVEQTQPPPSPEPSQTGQAEPSPSPSPMVYGDNVMDIDFDRLNAETSDETLLAMNEYVRSQTPSNKNAYTGLFKGKNLILICAEAFCDNVVNEELTPTLYRLVHNGFYFSEFYQPTWGGSTSTGEFSFLFGLAPVDGIETMMDTQTNNNYFTMGNQLKRIGYSGDCYHDGEYDFYSRYLTHVNLGYDHFYGLGNGLEDISGWWPGDNVMFDTTMDTYLDKQPFSVYYMTVSGHCVYSADNVKVTDNLSRVEAVFGSRYKKTTMYYFCYQLELEDALTTMIQKLEEKGIADDTVIAMTGDHYPYGLEKSQTFGNSEDYLSDLYGYTYQNSWQQDHNALIIWSGCLEHDNKDMACEIPTPTYSLDVTPTLSNLFGLEYDSRLLVGRDVFSDAEPLALWNNYSWATVQGKYDGVTDTYYPNEGYPNDQDYVDRINAIVSNKLIFSERVVNHDYYGYLFGDGA